MPNPLIFHIKIRKDDYVWHKLISWYAKFGENSFTGASPRIGEIYRLRDFLCLFVTFFYCRPLQEKTTELILTHDGSYDAVSRKEVPFGGYKI